MLLCLLSCARQRFRLCCLPLFFLLLFGSVAAGTAIVAIVAGTKDYRGIDRGLYIDKGKKIYMAGIMLGVAGLCLLVTVLIIWTVF